MTARRRTGVRAALVVGSIALVLAAAGCASPGAVPGDVVVGSCRGFASAGGSVTDRALLDRAAATWRLAPTAPESTTVAPPRGPVCVVEAGVVGGRSSVTLVGDESFVVYTEALDGSTPGVLSAAGRLPSGTPVPPPALPVGGGRWRLASSVVAATAYVGAPGLNTVVRELDPASPVPIQQLVTDVGNAHPRFSPHLVVLARTATGIVAMTGGGAYAPSFDSVFAVALSTATEGGLTRAWDGYVALLTRPSYVALLAQAIGFSPSGRQEPQRVSRQLSVVGTVQAPRTGPVLVVSQEPDDGSHGQPAIVSLAQLSGGGANVAVIGAVLSPTGAWSAGAWLDARMSGGWDPRELVVMGRPAILGGRPLVLTAAVGGVTDTVRGPVAVVSTTSPPAQPRPAFTVKGVGQDGTSVLPLGPAP